MGSTGRQPARCSPPAPPLQGSARRRVSIAVIPKQLLVRTRAGGTGKSCAPLSDMCPQAQCYQGPGSPLMLPPLVPSQVPARTAEQPLSVSWRGSGPSAGPASRGNHAGWWGGHGTGCCWPAEHGTAPCPLPPQERAGAAGPEQHRDRGASGRGRWQRLKCRGRGAGAAWADVSSTLRVPSIPPVATGLSVVPWWPAHGKWPGGFCDGRLGCCLAVPARPCSASVSPVHCRSPVPSLGLLHLGLQKGQ